MRHRLRWRVWRDWGPEPTLTITVVGVDDVYRLARVLEAVQVDLAEHALGILRGLDRKDPGLVRRLVARMGTGPLRGHAYLGVRPRPKP